MFGHGKNILSTQSVITPLSLQTNKGHKRFLKCWLYRCLFFSFSPECSVPVRERRLKLWYRWFDFFFGAFIWSPKRQVHPRTGRPASHMLLLCMSAVWHLQFCEQDGKDWRKFNGIVFKKILSFAHTHFIFTSCLSCVLS